MIAINKGQPSIDRSISEALENDYERFRTGLPRASKSTSMKSTRLI